MKIIATASTHTFLFADIAGFSTIAEVEGDMRATELALTLAGVANEVTAVPGADLVKAIGDAVMIRTADAGRGLDIALALRRALEDIPGFPGVHAGLHTGPAVQAGGDWYGHTVNVAFRVSAAAGPGEIFCTQATLTAAGELRGVRAAPCGCRAFKNAVAQVDLFSLDRVLSHTSGRPRSLAALATA